MKYAICFQCVLAGLLLMSLDAQTIPSETLDPQLKNILSRYSDLEKGEVVRVEGIYTGFNDGQNIPTSHYRFITTFVPGAEQKIIIEVPEYETPASSPEKKVRKKLSFIKEGDVWYELTYGFYQGDKFSAAKAVRKLSKVPPSLGAGNFLLGSGISTIPAYIETFGQQTLNELIFNKSERKSFIPHYTFSESQITAKWTDPCESSDLEVQLAGSKIAKIVLIKQQNLCTEPKRIFESTLEFTQFSDQPFVHASKISRQSKIDNKVTYKCSIEITKVSIDKGASVAKFPVLGPGWTVQDSILGISYLTGRNPTETIESIKKLFD